MKYHSGMIGIFPHGNYVGISLISNSNQMSTSVMMTCVSIKENTDCNGIGFIDEPSYLFINSYRCRPWSR